MNRTREEEVLAPKKLATHGSNLAGLADDYLEAVKSKFQDHAPEKYEEFLEVLKSIKSRSYPDLIVGFNNFFPPGYAIATEDGECEPHTGTGEVTNMQQHHELEPSRTKEDTEYIFGQEVKKKLGNSYDYHEFLKCLYMYSEEIISRDELKGMVVSFKKIFGDQSSPLLAYSQGCIENPSYRLWPKNRPIPLTSYRTELGYEVLNDILFHPSFELEKQQTQEQKNNNRREAAEQQSKITQV
ncbi:hypothetical protein MKW98_007863 [Papaver atlanticum]|uniref:Histone deacetylase interacting domain-containing protein n=1 Tax=Papaver atlanticum TaxID=357466 RepID=A0AAD4X4A4_9MAGN|nr:hypothetical protein MKW98_007863 [Papaver atlanticum]